LRNGRRGSVQRQSRSSTKRERGHVVKNKAAVGERAAHLRTDRGLFGCFDDSGAFQLRVTPRPAGTAQVQLMSYRTANTAATARWVLEEPV